MNTWVLRAWLLLFLLASHLQARAQTPVDGTYGGPGNGGVYEQTGTGAVTGPLETEMQVTGGGLYAADPFSGGSLTVIGALVDAGGGLYTVRATELPYPLELFGIPSATVFHIAGGSIRATNRAGASVVWLDIKRAGSKPPEITQQPVDVVLTTETTAFLNVRASGDAPLRYQWYRNDALIPGAEIRQYQVIPLPNYVGTYYCVVSNPSGSTTSSVVRVRVEAPAPTLILPSTFELALGRPQGFGAIASGGQEPYSYTWEKNGVVIPGATGSSLNFPDPAADDAGTYRCTVTDGFGNQATRTVTVTLQLPPAPRFLSKQAAVIQSANTSLLLRLLFESQQTLTPPTATWRRNGVPVAGTSVFYDNGTGSWVAVFQVASSTPSDSGSYDCVATGLGGTTVSETTRVLVKAADAPDTLDLSFDAGTAHRVAFNNPNGSGAIEAIAIQTDDRILVAGTFKEWNGQARTNLVRLNVNGSLDTTFAAHHFTEGVNGDIAVPGLAVAPDGRIYVAGVWKSLDGVEDAAPYHLIRLNPNGTLDASFDLPDLTSAADELVVLPDGTLYNNGLRLVGNRTEYLLRFPQGGALDPAFGTGYSAARFSGNTADAMVATPDGGIYVGGGFGLTLDGFPYFSLARINANGTMNPSFRSPLKSKDIVTRLALQSDNKLIAVGDFADSGGNVKRFLADGSLDATFQCPVKDAAFSPLALAADGAPLVAPNTGNNLARLNPDGSVDDAFTVVVNDNLKHLAVDSKGRIVIAGFFTTVRGSFDDLQHEVNRKYIARLAGSTSATPTAPVTLGGISRTAGGAVGFSIPTQPGLTYFLEKTSDLGTPDWASVASVTGDGTTKSLEAPASGQAGFLRIRVQR
ncbi:MAG: hypothetical protein IT580_19160 [Verrucomicrobiales bacterium]|nr:hypothetical protein [Verrucomicrobiales bacterium]